MPFLIVARDKPGTSQRRVELRPAHLAHLDRHGSKLLAAGAMLSDDGTTPVGSLIVFDAEARAEVDAFMAADPYSQAGLFETIEVRPWRKVFLAGERSV